MNSEITKELEGKQSVSDTLPFNDRDIEKQFEAWKYILIKKRQFACMYTHMVINTLNSQKFNPSYKACKFQLNISS